MPERVRLQITPREQVTAMAYPAAAVDSAGICLLLAHGAGANQTSGFMVRFASALAARGIDTVTFNFIYSEDGRRIPDRNISWSYAIGKSLRRFMTGTFRETLVGKSW
jgi:predicted alpha/beta-hydrolase family hydrolase